jgi:guanosine-3',5'-bis(diphosphate) 3'-pyrophosphohydrolase
MKKQNLLSNAIHLATRAHDGQFDKAGVPYILHCLKVMHYLKSNDEELNCIAVLHDILEDTVVVERDLKDYDMTNRIIEGVKALTKIDKMTKEEYLSRIKTNSDAIKVKMADLRHNSDIRRLKDVRQKDFDRIVKYHSMYQELKIALNEL